MQRTFVASVPKYAKPVLMNAKDMRITGWNTAGSVLKPAGDAQKNAAKWLALPLKYSVLN